MMFETLCLHRCLLAGDKYDLQVVFRLFQLWFSLGHDQSVNAQLNASFMEIPSYKLLSLVYQIASRMSAAKKGPYYESGFQASPLTQAFNQPNLLYRIVVSRCLLCQWLFCQWVGVLQHFWIYSSAS